MTAYDLKVDSKGRLLLPKAIRGWFAQGARLRVSEGDVVTLEPLVNKTVCAEIDVVCPAEELVVPAWKQGVHIIDMGPNEENGYPTVRCVGAYNDVREFCAQLGYPEEDFEELLI